MKRYIKSALENGRKDAELLATDGSWELWTPHTFEASIYLARKGADRDHWARWDTAYEGNGSRYFDHFTKKGPLYIFINKADPTNKYQYHAETDSFYDWNDRPADFKSFICEHPAFAEFFGIDCDDVDACDKVTAAIQLPIAPEDTIYDLYQIATEWCDDSEVDQIFINNGTSPDSKSIVDENTNVMQAYIDLVDYIRNNVSPDILNEREYALVYGNEVEACDKVNACGDQKYFANMVNCSSDPELDDNFLIEGYYDSQRRGLAESAETSDVSALNDLANEYANKGYYIVVHNLTDGVITEFSADNWFNDIAPDGGAELFMSW